ncbi:MAG: hypothetical protein HZC42_01135 [Candidatus Eisenbacteria bacterium]|nr:hypothetical protein [Candidatus Eisenbacteria bacterium]
MRAARRAGGPRRACALAAALGLAALLGACARRPAVVPGLTRGQRIERFAAALAQRQAKSAMAEAEAVVWARRTGAGALPALQATLALARPDRFRLRAQSLFGTALDLAARGDSLTAYVPSQRAGAALDATRDSLGVRSPGTLACRALSADWRPPDGAWERAERRDSLIELRWQEAGDSLAVAVGVDGLPEWATLTDPEGRGARVRYEAWRFADGVMWPALVVLEDRARSFAITCRIERVRFRPQRDDGRFAVRIPGGARRLGRAELRRLLARLEERWDARAR